MRSPRVSSASVSAAGLTSGISFGTCDGFVISLGLETLCCCVKVRAEELASDGAALGPLGTLANALASRSFSCFARRSAFVVTGF